MMRRLFGNGFYLVYTGVALLTAGFFFGMAEQQCCQPCCHYLHRNGNCYIYKRIAFLMAYDKEAGTIFQPYFLKRR